MTSQASSSTISSMSQIESCFDTDIDSFLDLDQNTFTPSSATPDSFKGKSVIGQRPSLSTSNSSNFISSQPQPTFSGPSFQYDSYRQQTGLPVGGLANTFALNQATGMQYTGSHQGFVMPTETLNMPLSDLEDFDFGRHPSVDMSDMDFDTDSPSEALPTMFFPSSSSNGPFINPNALVGQEDLPSTYTAPVQRMYPGMHTQQAAQAKAQQAQKQQEMRRQQQEQPQGQKPLPSQAKPQQQKDPHVEESISRLLHQMRQNSVASVEDDASTPTGNTTNLSRLKKDEEDMDEDERLLASEEGKKLSSKERRQLRNKVSARAFRSRRKEYIGQLEGELAVKNQEANDLRAHNRQLLEENTRLTDLTRMLLSSQAFSGFLNDLSANGMPAPATTTAPAQVKTQSHRKDVNPHQAVRQSQGQKAQVGMAMVPESAVDFSMLEIPASNNWNASLGMNNFQVCAVMDVPQGPAVDSALLSGKASNFVELRSELAKPKDLPVLESPPFQVDEKLTSAAATAINYDVDFDETAFSLFVDSSPAVPSATLPKSIACSGNHQLNEKPSLVNLVIEDSDGDDVTSARLERMCLRLDILCDRISAFTSHLS